MQYNPYLPNYGRPTYTQQMAFQQPTYPPQIQQPYANPQVAPQPQTYQQQPTSQQPVTPQAMPQVDLPFSDIRFLTSDQIKGFIVYPNTKVMLIDKENKLAHIMTADGMGQSSSQVYKFESYVAEQSKPNEPVAPTIDTSTFVQKQDFEDSIKKVFDKLEQMDKQIEKTTRLSELLSKKEE